jgi:Holliday junction resolvase RusA-like endonuclease
MWFLDWCPVWKGSVQVRELKMVFYGEPVAQGRPRFTTINGFKRAYDPVKSRNFKQWVRLCAIQVVKQIDGFKPFENALCVDVTFYRHIPSSWSRKKRMEADSGIIRPITRPDCGNYEKGFYDALTGIVWVDDSIITDKNVRKRYTADLARIELKITEVASC